MFALTIHYYLRLERETAGSSLGVEKQQLLFPMSINVNVISFPVLHNLQHDEQTLVPQWSENPWPSQGQTPDNNNILDSSTTHLAPTAHMWPKKKSIFFFVF